MNKEKMKGKKKIQTLLLVRENTGKSRYIVTDFDKAIYVAQDLTYDQEEQLKQDFKERKIGLRSWEEIKNSDPTIQWLDQRNY